MEDDPFDSVLNLEDKFYDEGYQLGVADGSHAGRIEGRVFGLEKGFEKYVGMGQMHGRSAVWAGRLPMTREQRQGAVEATTGSVSSHADELRLQKCDNGQQQTPQTPKDQNAPAIGRTPEYRLPTLADNPRLEKHIKTLLALVEASSLSTHNTEDAVSDFDDRLKRASAKAKIIERLIGEAVHGDDVSDDGQSVTHHGGKTHEEKSGGDGSIEEISSLQARH
ncbi:MAG: hypothetical protein M1830_008182 [Pleopsidium flavum]|nr:MAG: hypothetical protein M1830_008182 [Pleopsidium flavum]